MKGFSYLVLCTAVCGSVAALSLDYYGPWPHPTLGDGWAHLTAEDIVRLLDEGAGVHDRLPSGVTPLMAIAGNRNRAAIEELIAAGADVHAVDPGGRTPLLHAATHRNPIAIEALLEAGATVDARDEGGWTALMKVSRWGNRGAVEILLHHGADPTIRNHDGRTAYDVAAPSVTDALIADGAEHSR